MSAASTTTHLALPFAGSAHVPPAVEADVTLGATALQVRFRVGSGHIPISYRPELVELIFALPEARTAQVLQATLPLGDFQLLSALGRRCSTVRTRAAGATCLFDGELIAPAA
jgi:hypothetical protein